jgi:hypothetical protein
MIRFAAAFALALVAPPAHSRPPPGGVDPLLAPWFEDLRQPGTGHSCCSIADCRTVDARVVQDHYEAFIDDRWMVVPPDKILRRYDNPTGRAVVCWTPALGIMCFVQGPGV